MPDLDPMDGAVHELVREELALTGAESVADLAQTWSQGGQMWFTEVHPYRGGAAELSVAYQDETTLNCTVGNIWFEIFGRVEENLPYLRSIVAATFAGRVEEAGRQSNAFGRIDTEAGRVYVGAMHVPWPWRQYRRYLPYVEAS